MCSQVSFLNAIVKGHLLPERHQSVTLERSASDLGLVPEFQAERRLISSELHEQASRELGRNSERSRGSILPIVRGLWRDPVGGRSLCNQGALVVSSMALHDSGHQISEKRCRLQFELAQEELAEAVEDS
jgi:hypothetical protein